MVLVCSGIHRSAWFRGFHAPFFDAFCCCSALCSTVVGIGFPIYSTHKAIENRNHSEQEEWLVYWAGTCMTVSSKPGVGNGIYILLLMLRKHLFSTNPSCFGFLLIYSVMRVRREIPGDQGRPFWKLVFCVTRSALFLCYEPPFDDRIHDLI